MNKHGVFSLAAAIKCPYAKSIALNVWLRQMLPARGLSQSVLFPIRWWIACGFAGGTRFVGGYAAEKPRAGRCSGA